MSIKDSCRRLTSDEAKPRILNGGRGWLTKELAAIEAKE